MAQLSLKNTPTLKVNIDCQLFREDSASVYSGTLASDPHVHVALKLSNASNGELEHEATILYDTINRLKCPHLLKVWSFVVLDKQRALITECCKGPNLIDYIIKQCPKGLPENRVREISLQMFQGIWALHSVGISHRDIKLDNVMFKDAQCHSVVIIDFDSAASFDSRLIRMPQSCTRSAGTLEYMPPECADNFALSTAARDLWAAGVVLYGLLCGTFPFFPRKHCKALRGPLLRKVLQQPVKFKKTFSREVVDLLEKLLCTNPKNRMTIKQVFSHPWICKCENVSTPISPIYEENEEED